MSDLKHITSRKLLWLDLEMTGLNPQHDRIVEAAVIITDWDFKELAAFQSGVRQDAREIKKLFAANAWAAARPKETQVLIDLSAQSPSEHEVESMVLSLINEHFNVQQPVLLAGNSIHCDRGFIKQWWPRLEARLHYRMLDVSAWKVVLMGKYNVEFPKKESHRALDDIRESIAELQFYLQKASF